MPTLGGIPLLDAAEAPASGAAFELDAPAREDAAAIVGEWTVEVSKGLKLVVARGGQDARNVSTTLRHCGRAFTVALRT